MHCPVHRGDLPGTTATWLHLRRPATVYYRKPGLCPAARGGEHLLEEAPWNSAGWFLLLALHGCVFGLNPLVWLGV
jgi:hypothetical protein